MPYAGCIRLLCINAMTVSGNVTRSWRSRNPWYCSRTLGGSVRSCSEVGPSAPVLLVIDRLLSVASAVLSSAREARMKRDAPGTQPRGGGRLVPVQQVRYLGASP